MSKVVLATSSPYRIEAFAYLKIPFTNEASEVDESLAPHETPQKLVAYLSRAKAETVAARYPDAVVFGFDSVGYFEGGILEKPKTREENFARLKKLSGKTHEFFTGIYTMRLNTMETIAAMAKTTIDFRELSDRDITKYLDEDELYRTLSAGYNSFNHFSATFPRRIEGNLHNLSSGIPLDLVVAILRKFGVTL